jgi:hypothetical protein
VQKHIASRKKEEGVSNARMNVMSRNPKKRTRKPRFISVWYVMAVMLPLSLALVTNAKNAMILTTAVHATTSGNLTLLNTSLDIRSVPSPTEDKE